MGHQIGNRIRTSPPSFSEYRTRYACNDEDKLGPIPRTVFFHEVEQNTPTRNIYPPNRLHSGEVVPRKATAMRPRRTPIWVYCTARHSMVHGQDGLASICQTVSLHRDRVASHSMAISWSVCDAEIRSTGGLEAEELSILTLKTVWRRSLSETPVPVCLCFIRKRFHGLLSPMLLV